MKESSFKILFIMTYLLILGAAIAYILYVSYDACGGELIRSYAGGH